MSKSAIPHLTAMTIKTVTVDFSQADAALEILPERSRLTSQNLGWKGIHVQHLHQPPTWETPEFSNTQHVIAVHHFDEAVQLERTLDGKIEREYLTTGDIVITPAQTIIKGRWDKPGEVTLLTLEPDYFAQIAQEAVDSDCVKLEPQFALKDPLIASIGQSLKAELTTRQHRNQLYVNSLTTTLAAHLIQHYCTVKQPIRDEARGLPAYQLQRAIDYIHT
jgi:AraC family transcriptional regulator